MPITNPAALNALIEASLRDEPAAIEAPAPDVPHKGVSKWAQLATAAGHGMDAYSTIEALHNNPDAYEMNPLYGEHPSPGRVAAVKGGTAAMQMLVQHLIGKSHPGVANALGFGTGAVTGGIAAHNLAIAKQGK